MIEEVREAFAIFDRDGDGTISTRELGTALRALGQNPSDAEVTGIIKTFDVSNDGELNFEEFLAAIRHHRKEHSFDKEELNKVIFEVFNFKDESKGQGNTKVTGDEMFYILQLYDDLEIEYWQKHGD